MPVQARARERSRSKATVAGAPCLTCVVRCVLRAFAPSRLCVFVARRR